jgi:cysteinyl-tRNA synthetase
VEAEFHEDLALLRCKPAHHYPRATDHVPEMIEMIQALIASGHAYAADGNVYFDVTSFPAYGALSGNTLAELDAGASGRVEDRGDKRNPHDFALWKHDPKHLMQWDSPFGRGFPGWHIECSAMSRKYLGDTLDIHTGGPDNKFPHHECEIAQSESVTGVPFVRTWIHCGWVEIAGRKMAKSSGRMYTLPELVEQGYAGADLRLYLLKQSYRAPLPFDFELLDEARKIRAKLGNFVHYEMAERPDKPTDPAIDAALETARADFRAALEDDLNTSVALAAVHEMMTAVNRAAPGREDAAKVVAAMREFDAVLGVLDDAPASSDDDDEIDALVAERDAARAAKHWARADEIRDELAARGVELLDGKQATRWRRS